jgi:hypothetical protein
MRIELSAVRSEKGEKGGKSETGKDDRRQQAAKGQRSEIRGRVGQIEN